MLPDAILSLFRLKTVKTIQNHTPRPPAGQPAPVPYAAIPPPPPRPILTGNQQSVSDLIDALHTFPPQIESAYATTLLRAAALLGNPVPEDIVANKNRELLMQRPQSLPAYYSYSYGNVRDPWHGAGPNNTSTSEAFRNIAMMARNNVFDIVDRVNSFVARAKNAGFSPPDNPFVVIAQLNAKREGWVPVNVPTQQADDLIQNIGFYLELLKAEKEGKINLEKQYDSVAQLSSVGMSFEGFGGSGNGAADLMKFLPDADAVKVQKAKEALSVLDFKKRVPKVIFTSNYAPDGDPKGCIIGWRKMPDASGYIIKRRNIFDGSEVSYLLSNEDAITHYDHVKDYVKTWVLGFYREISPEMIYAFMDTDVQYNGYYTYKIQAYQSFNESRDTFRVETVPANISAAQRVVIAKDLEALDPGQGETISPYPILAKVLLGNDQLDWILAAVNVRASIVRNDPRSVTRKYSYLSSQLDFIYAQMDQGKFVLPKDVNQVVKNITEGITKFGITQMLMEVLQETGALYHFEGIDPKADTHFDRVGTDDLETSNTLSTIVASIDPETATMDLKSLSSNLPLLLDRGVIRASDRLSPGEKPNVQARPAEIEVPYNSNQTDSIRAEDEIQFLQTIPSQPLDRAVDLTTFEGISKFIRTVRVFADTIASRHPPTATARPPIPVPVTAAVPPQFIERITPAAVLVAQHEQNRQAAKVIDARERAELLKERVRDRIDLKKNRY